MEYLLKCLGCNPASQSKFGLEPRYLSLVTELLFLRGHNFYPERAEWHTLADALAKSGSSVFLFTTFELCEHFCLLLASTRTNSKSWMWMLKTVAFTPHLKPRNQKAKVSWNFRAKRERNFSCWFASRNSLVEALAFKILKGFKFFIFLLPFNNCYLNTDKKTIIQTPFVFHNGNSLGPNKKNN